MYKLAPAHFFVMFIPVKLQNRQQIFGRQVTFEFKGPVARFVQYNVGGIKLFVFQQGKGKFMGRARLFRIGVDKFLLFENNSLFLLSIEFDCVVPFV